MSRCAQRGALNLHLSYYHSAQSFRNDYMIDSTLFNEEFYLKDHHTWTKTLAEFLAHKENIQLTEAHSEVIHFARSFYQQYHYSPIQRLIIKHMQKIDPSFNSIVLQTLFPKGPRQICLIAGLPKPARCV